MKHVNASKRRWVTALALTVCLSGARPAMGLLSDMAAHWSAPLVGALEAKGIVSGDEQGRFQPDAPLTRAQLAKLLVTGLGHVEEAELLRQHPSRFRDIPSWHWARGYVESMAELAVIEGYPDGTFAPDDYVTRGQLALILTRVVGLTDQARALRFEPTSFRDDATVPDWARGAVNVARTANLMGGFEDNTFRPLQTVTRAEGSVALMRVLGFRGSIINLTGTIVRFDSGTGQGLLRNEGGQEHEFTMAPSAQYFRGGVPAAPSQIKLLDQVWIVLGEDSLGRHLDARFTDSLGRDLQVDGRSVRYINSRGVEERRTAQAGALVYVNGLPTTLDKAAGASRVYLLLDRMTGEVRALDAVHVSVVGRFSGMDLTQRKLQVETDGQFRLLSFAPDVRVLINSSPAGISDLYHGDRLELVLDSTDTVIYLLAER